MKKMHLKTSLTSPPEGWIKINLDASKRHTTESTLFHTVIGEGNQIGNCLVLVAECLVAIQKNLQQIIIENISQLTFNNLYSKISVPRNVIYLVKDIRNICLN